MDEVADRNRLEHRKGVWYYRRRVPDDLVTAFGRQMIRQSLRTGSIKEAQKRRNILDVQYDAQFEALRHRPVQDQHAASSVTIRKARDRVHLSREQVRSIIAGYVDGQITQFQRSILSRPPDTTDEKNDLLLEKEMVADVLGQPGHMQQQEWVADAFSTMFGEGRFADLSSVEAAELVRRGLLEIARREAAILSDDFDLLEREPSSRRGTGARTTFGEIAREYLRDEIEKAEINERKQQWSDKVTAHVEFLIAFFGEDTPISRIDYDEAKKLQSALARMPANRRKKYPSLTIEQAIERAAEQGARLLSPVSQARYLDFFRGIMTLATAKRLVPGNPATDLRPIKQDTLSASEKRPPFTTEQIAEIFDSEFYRLWLPGTAALYRKPDRDWRFWLPLLLAFTGMRPGEVCQMLATDIVQSPGGVWFARVIPTDDEDDDASAKSVKTAFSRRNVPIHPELLSVGFLDFVDARRGDNAVQRLFPGLKKGPRGYFSDYPCRRFREVFLPKMVELQPRQTVYSFRHSFRDALRRIKAPDDVVSALGGWSEGKKVSDAYGNKNDPDYLFSYIEQISYPGTTLDFRYLPLP